MNERAAQALYDAERSGVRQITGMTRDTSDGRCAVGVLQDAGVSQDGVDETQPCPVCGRVETNQMALRLVAHLNDDHRLTFSEIARKLGPDHA